MLITSGLNYHGVTNSSEGGRIFTFDLNQFERDTKQAEKDKRPVRPRPKAVKVKIIKSSTSGDLDPSKFAPHGMSVHKSGGHTHVYVVNHQETYDAVESFTWDAQAQTLTHVKTHRDEQFHSLNDVAAVDPDKFFVTNDHYFVNDILRLIEDFAMLHWTNLIFYDGHKGTVVDTGLAGANGIAIDFKRQFLYLAQPPAELIRVYKLDTRSFTLKQHFEISLLTSPDNIWVNQENGELFVGCHPVVKEALQYLLEPSKYAAPSQVLRIRMQEGHRS